MISSCLPITESQHNTIMPSSRICIKIDSYNDKTLGKLKHRANKLGNRARRRTARTRRQSKFNKPEHREQGSYKPRPSSPPRQTRSYHTLTVELKKIEDAFLRSWEEFYEEMAGIRLSVREEEDERSYEPPAKQPVEPVEEIRDPRYIGEETLDELSWGAWEGDDDSWEEACGEWRQMEAYDRQVEQEWEEREREAEEERNFQFKDGVFW